MTPLLLLLTLACPSGGLPDGAGEYVRLLSDEAMPTGTRIDRCLALPDPTLAADCALAAAEAAPAREDGRIEDWCPRLPVGVWRDECQFQAAERALASRDRQLATRLCLAAGRFTDECGYHLWQQPLRALIHRPGPSGFAERLPEARALYDAWASRLAASTDMEFRFWSRYFEMGFEPQFSVQLSACDPLEEPYRAQCVASGVLVWRHRLENAVIPPEAQGWFCARTAAEASVGALLAERTDIPFVPGNLLTMPRPELDEALAWVRSTRCP